MYNNNNSYPIQIRPGVSSGYDQQYPFPLDTNLQFPFTQYPNQFQGQYSNPNPQYSSQQYQNTSQQYPNQQPYQNSAVQQPQQQNNPLPVQTTLFPGQQQQPWQVQNIQQPQQQPTQMQQSQQQLINPATGQPTNQPTPVQV